MSKCIKLVVCAILVMIFFPTAVLAVGEPVCVNTTTGTEYSTIADALARVSSGQTLELLQDTTHTDENTISIINTNFTLNLNGHILNIISTSETALDVIDSQISLTDTTGSGEFNVTGKTFGVYAMGSSARAEVTVTNATATGDDGCGAYAYGDVSLLVKGDVKGPANGIIASTNSVVTVLGDCSGGYSAIAHLGGVIYVYGNVTTDRYCGALAEHAGSKVVVKGDCIAKGGARAASAYKGEVIIEGDVYGSGVSAYGNGELIVNGNVFSEGLGAAVSEGGKITVNGVIDASPYVAIDSESKDQEDDYTPTTKVGYHTYKKPSGSSSTVWVKYIPNIASMSATPDSIPFSGGSSTITLTGDLLFDGIRVTAFSADTVTAITSVTTGDIHTQTASLIFPSNTSTTADKEYVIKFSANDGQTWLSETISITVAKTIRHTVTFDSQGGSVVANQSILDQGLIPMWTNPTKTGYTFIGWYKEANCETPWDFANDRITAATTLYAKWTINAYTVVYARNGGTGGSTATSGHVYNTSRELTVNGFTRTGYTFAGWATSAAGPVAYTDGQSVQNLTSINGATVTLYANWTANTYPVAYESNGGGGSTAASSHVYDTARALTANGFTRTGYTFVGWATSATGPVAYTDGQNVLNLTSVYGATVTLYATWTITTYTVAFNSQGGSAVPSKTANYNTAISTPANPMRTGYTFAGWFKELTFVHKWDFAVDTVTSNTTLYARWTPVNYSINYILNDGTVSPANPANYTIASLAITLRNPARTGYTFAGWTGTGISGTSMSLTIPTGSSGDREYMANWSINNYTVTFSSQGSSTVASQSIAYQGFVSKPANPTRTGYTFNGWYKDTAGMTPWSFTNDRVTAAIMLYAKWTINNYTITFISQGGSTVPSQTKAYKCLLTKPADPTRTGYTFDGWYRETNCVNPWDFSTDQVIGSIKLYAGWTIGSYQVRFNSQGGSAVASQTVAYRDYVARPATPTRSSYLFGGWYFEASCITPWNFSVDFVTGNMTLYAKWTVLKYAVTVSSGNTNYGTVIGGGSIPYGTSATVKAVPKAGYRFVRWLEGTTAVSTSPAYTFTVTKARTLNAEFAKIGTPAVKAVSVGYDSVKLAWAAVAGAKGYEVSRYDPATKLYKVLTMVATTNYTNTGLTTDKIYSYKVRAKCAAGSTTTFGGYSAVVSAKPLPTAPTGVKAVRMSSSSIKVSWSAVAGANGYEVSRATASNGAYTPVKSVTMLNLTNTGLVRAKTYYYKVRAYQVVVGRKVYSPYSMVVFAKP